MKCILLLIITLLVLWTPLSKAAPISCAAATVSNLTGEFEVSPRDDRGWQILYVEKDSAGNPIDRGYLLSSYATNKETGIEYLYIKKYWVDGGADDNGKPQFLRGADQPTTSLRRQGISQRLFEKLLERVGSDEIIKAELAYVNIRVIWSELFKILGLPEETEGLLKAVRAIIDDHNNPSSPNFQKDFEQNLYRQAIQAAPYVKAWKKLGYTEIVEVSPIWYRSNSLENWAVNFYVSLRKPKQ